ncbi:MAG TPA: hypothetical protein VLA29_02500 [Acidimicrobiia bacterium]|nr:hypothetical protein [Acidimicrobiia bacterium]
MTPIFSIVDGSLVCTSDRLQVTIDGATGGIRSITDAHGHRTFVQAADARPWRLIEQGTTLGTWAAAAAADDLHVAELEPGPVAIDVKASEARLTWQTSEPGVDVFVVVRFTSDGDLELWPTVVVDDGSRPPAHLVYPILHPVDLGADDQLLFPAHSGWLIADPRSTITDASYPDGYHGCSVQVMAYFSPSLGGLSMACHDPHVTHKHLRFGADEWSVRHDAWDLRRGHDMNLDYPVVISRLDRGDWFEAAERYREWALTAPWTSRGPNTVRSGADRPRWLYEDIGLSIWGTPSSLDWSTRYRYLAEATGSTLHIVSGWDWPATRPHYIGTEGWFPTRINPANLDAWDGHHVTPYLNDLFVSVHAPDFIERWEPNLVFPYKTFPFTVFAERSPDYIDGQASAGDPRVMTDIDFFVCPTTDVQRELHPWRDARLVGDHGLAGVFYDISSGNPFAARCLRVEHGHTPGWSREVLAAYADNNARSRVAMAEAIGEAPAQGVETIVEHVIADIDFYVARACAGPIGGLEALTLGPEKPPGTGRDLVPLFQAIYHDVGPVHEDGWMTLDDTFGDLFYWIVARIALVWGGVMSLHYANNPPELIPGSDFGEVISWDGGHHRFDDLRPVDAGHLDFVRAISSLRTGAANPYLAYGRMLPPPPLDVPSVTLDYRRTNPVVTGLTRSGSWDVPQVVTSAWEAADGTVGVFFVNVGAASIDLSATVRPVGWALLDALADVVGGDGEVALSGGDLRIDLSLAPRSPVTAILTGS